MSWRLTIHSFKGGTSNSRVKTGIIPEFSQGQLVGPSFRTGTDKASQKSFEALVYSLCLSIRLRIVSSVEPEFNLGNTEEFLLK
jgi:hypothetical protein